MSQGFKLYLIRHGESANNALPESQRVNDPLLTERGQRQARHLGERFKQMQAAGTRFDILLTSAFRRTMQTIRPVADQLNMQPQIWSELFEVGGCYDGHLPGQTQGCTGITRAQLQVEFPDYIVPADIDENGWYKKQPIETRPQASLRAERQALRLLAEFGDRDVTVVCVIHADFKGLLLEQLLPDPYPYLTELFANTSVTTIDFSEAEPRVDLFNDTEHLPESLVSH